MSVYLCKELRDGEAYLGVNAASKACFVYLKLSNTKEYVKTGL